MTYSITCWLYFILLRKYILYNHSCQIFRYFWFLCFRQQRGKCNQSLHRDYFLRRCPRRGLNCRKSYSVSSSSQCFPASAAGQIAPQFPIFLSCSLVDVCSFMQYNHLQSLLVLIFKLSQTWPVATPSCCLWSFLCGPTSPGVLSCFLAQQNIPGQLVLSLLQTLSCSFLPGALVSFSGDGYLETKIWVLGCLQWSWMIVYRPFQYRPRKYVFKHHESTLIILNQNQFI